MTSNDIDNAARFRTYRVFQAIAFAKMIVQHWEQHGQTQVSMNYNGDEPGEVVVARALLQLDQAMKDFQRNVMERQ
jgi:hypothetical protein